MPIKNLRTCCFAAGALKRKQGKGAHNQRLPCNTCNQSSTKQIKSWGRGSPTKPTQLNAAMRRNNNTSKT